MALTDDLSRRIKAKRQEIAGLEQQMAALEQQVVAAKSYVQALDDALKMAERSAAPTAAKQESRGLRKGSMPAKAYPVLKRAGKNLYLVPLLEAMGLPLTNKNKRTLASSLSAYARKGEIFTRPEPNTFGLVEFEKSAPSSDSLDEQSEYASGAQAQLKLAR